MTMRAFARTAVLLVVAVFVLGVGAPRADPLVVTSGFFLSEEGDPTAFRFVGDDFDFRAVFAFAGPGATLLTLGPLQTCNVCSPGTRIDLSARATGAIGEWVDRPFPNLFKGSASSTVYFSGDLSFDAPTLTAPAIASSSLQVVDLVAPFLFTGQLTGFATADRTGNALFSVVLTGRGNADTIISTAGAGHPWLVEGVDYRFTSADVSPTPEPATLMLLATGVFTAATARRRRAKGQRPAA